jgi:hypothetical protein
VTVVTGDGEQVTIGADLVKIFGASRSAPVDVS